MSPTLETNSPACHRFSTSGLFREIPNSRTCDEFSERLQIFLFTCSSGYESVEEDGKQICRIGVCGVAPKSHMPVATVLARYSLATRFTTRARWVTQLKREYWMHSCTGLRVVIQVVSSCCPLKYTVPSAAKSELPKCDFFCVETVTFVFNRGLQCGEVARVHRDTVWHVR